MASGRERAKQNTETFRRWIRERHHRGDWDFYVRGGRLSRTEIVRECGFARSVIAQNPNVKKRLRRVERLLHAHNVLAHGKPTKKAGRPSESAPTAVTQQTEPPILVADRQAEQRMKALEEQNAALLAQVRELREQLMRYKMIEDHLTQTGRLVRP